MKVGLLALLALHLFSFSLHSIENRLKKGIAATTMEEENRRIKERIKSLKVTELRDNARQLGVHVGGLKRVLVQRLSNRLTSANFREFASDGDFPDLLQSGWSGWYSLNWSNKDFSTRWFSWLRHQEGIQSGGVYEIRIVRKALDFPHTRSNNSFACVVYVGKTDRKLFQRLKEHDCAPADNIFNLVKECSASLLPNESFFIQVRWKACESPARVESQLLAAFDYSWNKRGNGKSRVRSTFLFQHH